MPTGAEDKQVRVFAVADEHIGGMARHDHRPSWRSDGRIITLPAPYLVASSTQPHLPREAIGAVPNGPAGEAVGRCPDPSRGATLEVEERRKR